ncbi:MAG: ABC transporter permease [Chloroflexi bacterium]|nr:ABC transporter permease [Chloroflexota bacterium]
MTSFKAPPSSPVRAPVSLVAFAPSSERSLHSPTHRAWQRFRRHRLALLGSSFLAVLAVVALGAPLLALRDPYLADFQHFRAPPDALYLLGTDAFGRDILSRVIFGTRVSLSVGLVSVSIYLAIAIVLGSLAGYYRGKVDSFIMRLVDVVLSFPTLLIILFFVAVLGPNIYNTMLAIGLLGWPGPTRLVRGQILSLREMDYVLAARSGGVPDRRIILRHILPGVVGPLAVNATFGIAGAILTEAALSFLGLGVQPPEPSWGNMLTDARSLNVLETMPWLWLPPGLAILWCVLSINFVGDGLRDALDPRGRET